MTELRPISILLAEDNVDHAELIVDTLAEFNVDNEIVHVVNGELALALLRKQPPYEARKAALPDLILLDIKMPRLNGIATLEAIKTDPKLRHIPVVMISTSTTESEINHCYTLGANSYINKPLQFEEFSKKIKDLNLFWVLTSRLPTNQSIKDNE